jgi:transcriptional regulator with XRE-family HTH domain
MLAAVPERSATALGEIIRQQRELADLSMRKFAELVGISNPYLSQIENGLRAPSEQVLEGIADALKLTTDALYEQAGLTPRGDEQDTAVLDAIAADPRLTARQRSALREIYTAFVGDPLSPPRGGAAKRRR